MATEKVGYYTPDVAKYVLDSVRYLMTLAKDKKVRPIIPYDCWIFKTDGSGITARSGTTLGSGTCAPYAISPTGVLSEITQSDGTSYTITVYNLATSAVGSDSYIQAKSVGGQPVVDFEDC